MHSRDGKLQKCTNHVKGTHQCWFVTVVVYFIENKPHEKMIKNDMSFFLFYYHHYYYYFYFTILFWFCHTSTCICHGCTRVPHPEPPSHLPPNTIPLGHLSAPAPSFLYPASNPEFLKWSGVLDLWTCNIGIICRENNPASQAAVWRQGKEAI